MSILFSERINFSEAARDVPDEIVDEAYLASRKIHDPDTAKALFDQLVPILETCRPNRTFALACGMLMEKQRHVEGMLAFWSDLVSIFPDDLTALRMMMRWYRRERQTSEGMEKTYGLFPNAHSDPTQAANAMVAFAELRAFREIDSMMRSIFAFGAEDRALKMRYIKVLSQQSRYLDAAEIAQTIHDAQKMGPSSQDLLSRVTRRAAQMRKLYASDTTDAFHAIVADVGSPQSSAHQAFGNITFFTGQLGTGGAEKQLTRIAAAVQEKYERAETISGFAITAAPSVCVRHVDPSTGGDFYLPFLKKARVKTNVLTEIDQVSIDQLTGISAEIANVLDVLPDDIREQTCKLVPYFKKQQTRVAYLWQDGGVLSAALAAVLAGVPRIVTSFRGLPPNLRPNLMRPELAPLYHALSLRPEVTLTANSRCAAAAYERWLDLSPGTVLAIPNAIPDILPEGDRSDVAYWKQVEANSNSCDKTVLGIFRFDENKRPLLWIEAAAEYAQQDPTVRFLLLGSGYLNAQVRERVRELKMENRIFLAGIRKNVGFYLHRSDLVLHLARMEGLPNVLIEAHLAGKPVLATPAGGTSEVVTHGETGILLDSAEDPKKADIVRELGTLLSNPNSLSLMGKKALEGARPKFLIDKVLEKTFQIFAQRNTLQ